MNDYNSEDEFVTTRKSKRAGKVIEPDEQQSKKRKAEVSNSSSECSIRLASGKTISPALLAKLKNQIADNERIKKENEQSAQRQIKRNPKPKPKSKPKRISMREMYYKASDVSKEEIQAEEKEQRDAEVYSNLKTALQNRLYDVILNWNLFAPPQILPILPSSFQDVEEYIRLYLAFILQEMQAQAIKSLNIKTRKRCTIVQCTYDGSENECYLYLDSQDTTTFISTYAIIVPYLSTEEIESSSLEFSFEENSPQFHVPYFFGILHSQTGMRNAPYRLRVDVYQLVSQFPSLLSKLDQATNIVCSVYPLVQLSTTIREWTSLLLLHYCVYQDNDPRSLRFIPPSCDNTLYLTTPSKTSNTYTGSFIYQFNQQPSQNPSFSFIQKTVNDNFYQSIYPSAYTNFRLPLNSLLREVILIRSSNYRFIYAGENPSFLNDMNQNPHSYYVNGTSPQSPLADQFPWAGCTPDFISYLRDNYNRSQLFAVEACLYRTENQLPSSWPVSGFTLIQGPPGTGKTRTLLMLLNVLQNQQFDRYYEQLRRFINDIIFTTKKGFVNSLDDINKARIQMKEKLVKPRILVCTPSNAAVNTIIDNIIFQGFIDNSGKKYFPSILRLGTGTSPEHWSVSMEYIIENLQNADKKEMKMNALKQSLYDINVQIDRCFVSLKRLASKYPPEHLQLSQEYVSSISQIIMLFEEKDRLLTLDTVYHSSQMNTKDLQGYLLNNYDIILTTLSSSGLSVFDSDYVNRNFSVLVIDEACQATEVSTLIPLLQNPTKCVLIGDPKQLPATVLSENTQNNYNLSLFERFMNNRHYSYLLNTQYRCHPMIIAFPNLCFYNGQLQNGEIVTSKKYSHVFYESDYFHPVVFYNLTDSSVSEKKDAISKSYCNEKEARFILNLYTAFLHIYSEYKAISVVILTPYNEQKAVLEKLIQAHPNEIVKRLQVFTVDAFQGKEVDLVFYSTVRTGSAYGVGFVSDIRRMNVSFTRPRFGLYVIGNEAKLRTSKYWNQFIDYTYKNNRVITISDVDCNLESMIRENIRLHANNNMYLEYQQKHKEVALSLHQSVEDEYKLKEGRYSPEVIVPSVIK